MKIETLLLDDSNPDARTRVTVDGEEFIGE